MGKRPPLTEENCNFAPSPQILEYNGTDLRAATAEQAAYELAKPADKVSILAQYNPDKYNCIKDQGRKLLSCIVVMLKSWVNKQAGSWLAAQELTTNQEPGQLIDSTLIV